jgi:hypothetical protein
MKTFGSVLLLVVAQAYSVMPADRATDQQSLRLLTAQEGENVTIQVVANGQKEVRLGYRLTVSGASRANTSGKVKIVPNVPRAVAVVSITAKGAWKAVLDVDGDESYRQVACGTEVRF